MTAAILMASIARARKGECVDERRYEGFVESCGGEFCQKNEETCKSNDCQEGECIWKPNNFCQGIGDAIADRNDCTDDICCELIRKKCDAHKGCFWRKEDAEITPLNTLYNRLITVDKKKILLPRQEEIPFVPPVPFQEPPHGWPVSWLNPDEFKGYIDNGWPAIYRDGVYDFVVLAGTAGEQKDVMRLFCTCVPLDLAIFYRYLRRKL